MEQRKKAAIYIRVSTDAQREEGYSIDAQKEALTAYCISKQISNYEYYIDGGFTGSNLNRPEMQRMIEDAESGRLSHVVVYKLDRLSRSQKDTLYLIEDVLNPHQVAFVSLNESMDTGTPMGRLMLGILSAFAQLERENIRERTRMGMRERVRAGYWMGGGKIPFGYDYDEAQGILVPNADADRVREMYRLYLEGYSPQNIADMMGLKYDRLVIQILKRKTNIGVIVYQGEEYPGRHEPLISREVYEETMLAMEERSGKNLHSEVNLLTGLVYCGRCGAKMRYQKWGKKGHKLVCYSRQGSKPYLIRDPDCTQEYVWADEVEDAVAEDLFRFSAEKTLDPGSEAERGVLELLEQQLLRAEKKLKRLYSLYSEGEDEALRETVAEQKKETAAIREKLELEKNRKALSKRRKKTLDRISSLKEVWHVMTPMEKRAVVDQVIERVVVTGQTLQIEYKL
ncbi:recombinase family protein [Cuneatibacter sp. NSJ-177]|uniref:recombinase family protein n=1 Tax=Cuneatibacter sp. NSJ-177 TaxID=2931401 RepID=UPI001FD57253|nr:recombinase family protein [Cuneatibacter sp. NSJ-177]MCJ7834061.1 recombinase family protein [Cuneatibacter sp. NSJ-177]